MRIDSIEELPEQHRKQAREKINSENNTSVPAPNLESHVINPVKKKNETEEVVKKVCIHVHSKRKRLADIDGICAKHVIDGLVDGGILIDDSPKYVKEVTFSQEKRKKGEGEETVIEIREI